MLRCNLVCGLPLVAFALLLSPATHSQAQESEFAGLIRGKTQDRTSYQPPTVAAEHRQSRPADQQPATDDSESVDDESESNYEEPVIVRSRVRQVGYRTEPPAARATQAGYGQAIFAEPGCGIEAGCGMEPVCGCEAAGYACDGSCLSCDGGCDSFSGCDSCGGCGSFGCNSCQARLCLDPCQWFGSVELLLLWRVGDGLPVLATNSATPGAGQTLFGGERVLDDLTAGGRVTLGTWLDSQHCRSLVARGWGAEQDEYRFFADQNDSPTIARPFFNVTDGTTPANDTQVIAAPNQFNGSISINGSNSVYGGDVSLRQRWLGGMGGYIDLLYGYQYMRMEDRLRISTSSTVLPNNVNAGSIIDVTDQFKAENEFHGGQLGLAARYRERCWSFNGTIKAAAGSLRRTAVRSGSTTTSLAGVNAVDPNGLLVRSTNSGTFSDDTFTWVPELDASLGWRWTRNLDLTFGYNFILMSDALQVSGLIDPNLAVNAAGTPTGQQNPSRAVRYDTYYVHGLHFGLQCVY